MMKKLLTDIAFENIQKAAELKGWKTETYVAEHSEYRKITKLGFSTGRGVWYWFKKENFINSENTYVSFVQRYSQNNGRVSTGTVAGMKAKEMVICALDKTRTRLWT
jgi:hypothetical protein